jgi:cell filamentation protein
MLKTTEQKKKYIQETRSQNYQASLKLEGITTSGNLTQLSKAQILQNIKSIRKQKINGILLWINMGN